MGGGHRAAEPERNPTWQTTVVWNSMAPCDPTICRKTKEKDGGMRVKVYYIHVNMWTSFLTDPRLLSLSLILYSLKILLPHVSHPFGPFSLSLSLPSPRCSLLTRGERDEGRGRVRSLATWSMWWTIWSRSLYTTPSPFSWGWKLVLRYYMFARWYSHRRAARGGQLGVPRYRENYGSIKTRLLSGIKAI